MSMYCAEYLEHIFESCRLVTVQIRFVLIVALCSFAVSRFSLARSKTVSTSAGPRPFSNVSTRFTLCPGVFQIVDVSRPNLFLF